MTASTVTASRPSPTVHTARVLARTAVRLAGWFWAIALVGIVLASVVVWLVSGRVDHLISPFAVQAGVWFPFSQAIAIGSVYLTVHVAAGMTRRTFVRAALLVALGTGVGYTGVLAVLVLAERALHGALGWGSRMAALGLPVGEQPLGEVVAALAALSVPFVVGNLSGLLVGIVYLRFGALWGTLSLPLTVGPLVLVLYLLPFVPLLGTPAGPGRVGVDAVAGAVVAALLAAVFATLTRRTELPPAAG